MLRMSMIAVLAGVVGIAPAPTADTKTTEINGQYVEVRNCDIWTGPCFANAEGNLTGQNGAMFWRVSEGTLDGVDLGGLSVVAVLQASTTLGAKQTGPGSAVLIVDGRANPAQRAALVKLAQMQGGEFVKNLASIETATIKSEVCCCTGEACAEIDAGVMKIKTRCLDDHHDKICGNEYAYYPPLIDNVTCVPAVAEHSFSGKGLALTWQESGRRGAYVGTFSTR